MSRASRVPYHQNVYDLLGIEPAVCPDAARMIARSEVSHGPFPASLREWYCVPGVVELDMPDDLDPSDGEGTIWHDHLPHDGGHRYEVRALDYLLGTIRCRPLRAPLLSIPVLSTWGFYTWTWTVRPDGTDDPPVWVAADATDPNAEPPRRHSATFSEFIAKQFVKFYRDPTCPGHAKRAAGPVAGHMNGLWLRAPAEPFAVPVLDFLTEQFGEPERAPRGGEVTAYTWRPDGGTVRVTADHPAHPDPLSAWWVHARAPEQLARFADLLRPWGTLAHTLRADTDPARTVWSRVRGVPGA